MPVLSGRRARGAALALAAALVLVVAAGCGGGSDPDEATTESTGIDRVFQEAGDLGKGDSDAQTASCAVQSDLLVTAVEAYRVSNADPEAEPTLDEIVASDLIDSTEPLEVQPLYLADGRVTAVPVPGGACDTAAMDSTTTSAP